MKNKYFIGFIIIFAVFFIYGWLIRTAVWMDKGLVDGFLRAVLPW